MTGGSGGPNDRFRPVRGLIEHTLRYWERAWEPGSHLCIDESMATWEGASAGHLTYLPNKPHALGFCLKDLCDARSGFMLNMELQEGAEV